VRVGGRCDADGEDHDDGDEEPLVRRAHAMAVAPHDPADVVDRGLAAALDEPQSAAEDHCGDDPCHCGQQQARPRDRRPDRHVGDRLHPPPVEHHARQRARAAKDQVDRHDDPRNDHLAPAPTFEPGDQRKAICGDRARHEVPR
jgi:hypothetical protein